jgi:UDP-MurNAc hydroxylase
VVILTGLSHAGVIAEGRDGTTVMCDPWFGPAYYAGWFPFPDNHGMRPWAIRQKPDFLFVSHSHPDHFDAEFCTDLAARHPDVEVILPDYPLDELEDLLRACGLTRFRRTEHGVPIEAKGLKLTVLTDVSPFDGPMGDAALIIDDGETRVFNRNDSRPRDSRMVEALGPYDVHLGQHSGAVWWPTAYRMKPSIKRAAGLRKRRNQLDRYLNFDAMAKATFSVPNSGPPAFPDPAMFHLNDLGDDPSNVYPDQAYALQALGDRGRLLLPGTVATVDPETWDAYHRYLAPEDCFGENKLAHLDEIAEWAVPVIRQMYADLDPVADIAGELIDWFSPLVAQAERLAVGVGGNVVVEWDDGAVLLDFTAQRVRRWKGEPFVVKHSYDHRILGDMVRRRMENWVDDVWSGCRFEAERRGPYNDYVNAFFRCLSAERLAYAESWIVERDAAGDGEWTTAGDWRVQRFCPHARGDLSRVGVLEGNVLTCSQHGLRFDLETGLCLDADLQLRAERIS